LLGPLLFIPLIAGASWAGSISGGVRERNTDTPISGATVRLEQNGQIKFTTTTSASGGYSFSGIPNGTYNLVCLKLNCYQNWGPSARTLGNLTGQNIIMERFASITGGVRDAPSAAPIGGATVRLEQNGQIKYTTTANGSGVYSFDCIPPGTYNLVGLELSCHVNWSSPRTLNLNDHLTGQNIAMDKFASTTGVVRNAVTNAPISGATIRLWQGGEQAHHVVTDGNGVYSIACIVPGTYIMDCLKLGTYVNWGPNTRSFGANDALTGQDVSMTPCATITGGVRDAVTNQPLSGATVRLEQNGEIKYLFQYTGSDGVYSITGVYPGSYNLVGLHLGDYVNWSQPRTLSAGENVTGANIAMTPNFGRISGTVRDAVTGTPISGATVRLEQNGQIKYTFQYTAADGGYSFSDITPGTYNLVGLHLGDYVNWSEPRTLAAGSNLVGQDIPMAPFATITGVVRDAVTNQALSGATVRLEQNGQIKYTFQYTGSDGVYSITGINPGSYNLVGLLLGDYVNWSQPRTLGAGEHATNANIAMTPNFGRISGVVRDVVTGTPISGATVRLEQNGQIKYTFQYTAADGAYTFTGITPGTYNLVGLHLGDYVNWSQSRSLPAGSNLVNQDIAMSPTFARIAGGVRDLATSQAISGATVRLEQNGHILYTTSSNTSGNYAFTGIPPGSYNLVGLKLGTYKNWSQPRTLIAGDNILTANIAMVSIAASVSGTVRDQTSQSPVAGVTVQLVQNGQVAYQTTSTTSGAYGFSGLVAGTYTLETQQSGVYEHWSAPLTLNQGQSRTDVDIALTRVNGPPGPAISGTVTASGGGVVPGATVELYVGSTLQSATLTSGQGIYEFASLTNGDYTVVASRTGYVKTTSALQPYRGSSLTVPLVLSAAAPAPGPPDLVIGANDLSYTSSGGLAPTLVLTAWVHNNGGQTVSNARVRFYSLTQGGQVAGAIGGPLTIATLAPHDAKSVSLSWTPNTPYVRFKAIVDPDNLIAESNELNNSALLDLGTLGGRPPLVNNVTASIDGDADGHTFGQFLAQAPGVVNRFTAQISDPDNDVTNVIFEIDGRALTGTRSGSSWSVNYDVGTLAGGNRTIKVRAFDSIGLSSEYWTGTIKMKAWPAWLNSSFTLSDLGLTRTIKKGYISYSYTFYNAEDPGKHLMVFVDHVDPNILVIGGKQSKFDLSGTIELGIPLYAGLPWQVTGAANMSETVLGKTLSSKEVELSFDISSDGNTLHALNVQTSFSKNVGAFPERFYPVVSLYGVQISVGIGMEAVLGVSLDATFNGNLTAYTIDFTPTVGLDINGTLRIADPFAFARLELIMTASGEIGPRLSYARPPGHLNVTGYYSARIDGRLVGSVIWGIYSKEFYRWTWGPWSGTLPRSTPLQATMTTDVTAADSIAVPELFPYPSSASDGLGDLGLVWVLDNDPDPGHVSPEVYFAQRDMNGSWDTPERVTSNQRFETVPAVTYPIDGSPVAVWVENSLSEADTASITGLSDVLDRQDLWYSRRGGAGWMTPQPIVTDSAGPFVADGPPALARAGTGAMVVWPRSVGDSALAPGAAEVFASRFDGTSWSAPQRLTNDVAHDAGVSAASSSGDSVTAAWVREEPAGSNQWSVVWKAWDGADWSGLRTLRVANGRCQDVSLASGPGGVLLATWVEPEMQIDSTVIYRLFGATKVATDTVWSAPTVVHADSQFIETPISLIDRRGIGAVLWRGYAGYDGDVMIALRDLEAPGGEWTTPRQITSDSLTDWMMTASLDGDNNVHLIDLKSDLSPNAQPPAVSGTLRGLSLTTRSISESLEIGDPLEKGTRPLLPDLMLGVGRLDPGQISATVGDTLLLRALVRNIGDAGAPATTVAFFDGDPTEGGTPLAGGPASLDAVNPDGEIIATLPWVATSGRHAFYAVADAGGLVIEQDEQNNRADTMLVVLPDIEVDSLQVMPSNPAPGDTLHVQARIRNVGGAPSQPVALRLTQGAAIAGAQTLPALARGDSAWFSFVGIAAAGLDSLLVTADPDSAVDDLDRSNNARLSIVAVLPDLEVPRDSITYELPDSVGILTAVLRNLGGVDSPPQTVAIFSGDPGDGGILIDSLHVDVIPARSATRITKSWTAPYGVSHTYVLADVNGTIEERDRSNNKAFADILIDAEPEFELVPGSIALRLDGEHGWQLTAQIGNTGLAAGVAVPVEFFRGDPDSGGTLLGAVTVPLVSPRDTVIAAIGAGSPELLDLPIFAVIDRNNSFPEPDKSNNRATGSVDATVSVVDAAPSAFLVFKSEPNPFTTLTRIRFVLPRASAVRLGIFDVAGRRVRLIHAGAFPAGYGSVAWDGTDANGSAVRSGIYFARLECDFGRRTLRLMRLK